MRLTITMNAKIQDVDDKIAKLNTSRPALNPQATALQNSLRDEIQDFVEFASVTNPTPEGY